MSLPEDLQRSFKQEIVRYEEENKMPYVTSVERLAREEGLQQGIIQNARENLINVLEARFEEVPSSLAELINQIEYPTLLNNMVKRTITIGSLAEFQQELLQGAKEHLLAILESRFEELPSSLVDAIAQIENPSLLTTLLKRASTIGSVAEFQQAIA